MKNLLKTLLCGAMALGVGCSTPEEPMEQLIDRVFTRAEHQYAFLNSQLTGEEFPRTLNEDGTLRTSNYRWWGSGFYPGTMWYIYEYTHNDSMRRMADRYTRMLEPLKFRTDDHDVGFQLNCSYGNALRLTADTCYREPLVTGAHSLATRFNPTVGCTRSWDFVRKGRDWKFPVIIDNMMNMELLLVAANLTGEPRLMEIANQHATTTMKNHFRPDFTTFHLVDYDPETGAVRSRQTVQGYADSSAWARGQAWALYGYSMMFRMTNNMKYLTQAEKIASMLLDRLPDDGIPYWDFDDPKIPDTCRDASAGAIMASAFIELSRQTLDEKLAARCLAMAERQLRTLAGDGYLAPAGENGGFLLRHSVGALPDNSEVDVPLAYADYYFCEALLRYARLAGEQKPQ